MNLINFKVGTKGKAKFRYLKGKKNSNVCILYTVKVNSDHGIRLKTRMTFFIWPSLFLCNTQVHLNYCVGVKEKRPKNLTEIRIKIPKLKNFNIKTNFRCYTNHIWEFVANIK